ncbi:MAG TPA: ATP-binding protein [Actinomycetota bacterium]|nr:ATP-binding protein [Actinomycetota bacterium]
MRFRLTVPAALEAPGVVRDALGAFEDHVPPQMLEDARLMATELVTNAVRHGGLARSEALDVVAEGSPRGVRVEVIGGRRPFPAPEPPPHLATSGWGLYLVGRLSTRWGMFRGGNGTSVWFEIGSPAGSGRGEPG